MSRLRGTASPMALSDPGSQTGSDDETLTCPHRQPFSAISTASSRLRTSGGHSARVSVFWPVAAATAVEPNTPVVAVADEGWTLATRAELARRRPPNVVTGGAHGYDPAPDIRDLRHTFAPWRYGRWR